MAKLIKPRLADLGDGFKVRRLIPHRTQRMVGPFIFWDHMGPTTITHGEEMAVRPHPHIGLSTLTYLFSGAIMHADSLGFEEPIKPGEVNWMTAGRGIVHSERTAPIPGIQGQTIEGIQAWIALPVAKEECQPSFHHFDRKDLPMWEENGTRATLIAGSFGDRKSPVPVYSPLTYLDIHLGPDATFALACPEGFELAVYFAHGTGQAGSSPCEEGDLLVNEWGESSVVQAGESGARVLVFGGEPLPEKRHIWWNFVASSPQKIEQAKKDWLEQRFPMVEGDDEFIPLPPN